MNLREEIYNLLDESARVKAEYYTDEILKLILKRIDELRHTDELEYQDEEVDYGITLFHDMIKKELLK